MRNVITCLLLLLSSLMLLGCETPPGNRRSVAGSDYTKIVEIEGCEYIEFDWGITDQRVYSLTHKGNCKNPIHACK